MFINKVNNYPAGIGMCSAKKKSGNNKKISFKAQPWRLDTGSLEYAAKITGKEAVGIFEKFKLGNYLDLDGGANACSNSLIRKNNLSFLDKVKDWTDKNYFVQFYKSLTGFPDLWRVSWKIKEQFQNAVKASECALKARNERCNVSFYDVLGCGYDGVSSVAKNKALPGSDLDKAFVILRGSRTDSDEKIVNDFKAELWNNTDQRILSYNHDLDSFPKVYTDEQVSVLTEIINDKANDISKFGKAIPPIGIIEVIVRTVLERDNPPEKYNPDYVDANRFFIKLCKKFPKRNNWDLTADNPSRENVYNFGFVLETLKWGEHFMDKYEPWEVENSCAARHLNVSQIYSLRNSTGYKEKYAQREKLEKEFDRWDVDKQFRFIKSLIYSSCGESTGDFPEYFKSSEVSKFNELMKAVDL